ncbi:hypothetical protein BJ875DRAFT_244318 [Amylocarpus encephaloides]|uniref:BHLH domain-containing protein n=1 Tax=Amylocarpus encephaloides TaxID=45428 RepID=A0A9P7YSX3_9HELO|nr:hypothetical protein BJ875DRAFT_244318 [Amylocarpus encephaloides]
MFNWEFCDEVVYPQANLEGYYSSPQTKFADTGSLKWETSPINTAPWSGSDQTLSPMSALSQDFYSQSMFEPEFNLDVFPGDSLDSSMTATNTGGDFPLSSVVFLPTTDMDVDLFETTGNPSWQSESIHQTKVHVPRVDPVEQKHRLKDVPKPREPSIKAKSEPKTSRTTRFSKGSRAPPAPLKRTKLCSRSKPSKRQASFSSPPSSADPQTRTNHNLIERKYRNRLNGQFETLLSALPTPAEDSSRDEETEKRISKAEILTLAKERIESLERDMEALENQRGKLRGNLDMLQITHNSTSIGPDGI